MIVCYNELMVNKQSRKSRRGDTLIEVTIAIGIFSLIAVMAVMVVNASISGTQAVLENTVTREEINAQAEALRFIQAAYVADKDMNPDEISKYGELWQMMVGGARVLGEDEAADAAFLSYRPATCGDLYGENGIGSQGAFIINVRALDSDDLNNILVSANERPEVFRQTTSYPRIMYEYGDGSVDYGEVLYSPVGGGGAFVQNAEGIYVVAVQDKDSTSVVSGEGTVQKSAFIDFYIRSCWYTMNSKRPSTISTVIRLYNPDYMD